VTEIEFHCMGPYEEYLFSMKEVAVLVIDSSLAGTSLLYILRDFAH
jgi:hypothetical protein